VLFAVPLRLATLTAAASRLPTLPAAQPKKNSAALDFRKAVISRLFPRPGKPRRKNYI
jgi:hypothetical protein